MKAISIQQPWAWLIVEGIKDVENRTWWSGVRGTVAIHASKSKKEENWEDAQDLILGIYPEHLAQEIIRKMRAQAGMFTAVFGGIIGTVDIYDCVKWDKDRLNSPWHIQGQYGFYLANPKKITPPILGNGKLGFFELPYYVEDEIKAQFPKYIGRSIK